MTLIPTTIGGLLSAIGIAGMDRLVRLNVIARSGRAVEAAGDVHTLMLDKTGTITFGNRRCSALHAAPGVTARELGRVPCWLAGRRYRRRQVDRRVPASVACRCRTPAGHYEAVAFSAETRLSGIDFQQRRYRKGAVDAVLAFVGMQRLDMPPALAREVERIAQSGGTPCWCVWTSACLGWSTSGRSQAWHPRTLRRIAQAGIRTVMVTGDNPLTAAAIAAEAGVDDVLAEATPEKAGAHSPGAERRRLVAMCGDGANDAPALAQADVGMAMNDGTRRRARRPTWSIWTATRPSCWTWCRSASSCW